MLLGVATLVVITAAAIAAIVQLRHLRTSNQLSALLEIMNQWNQPALQAAYAAFTQTQPAKLSDPEYVRLLRAVGSIDRGSHPEFLVFDLWEQVGTYAKYGLIDEAILLDITASQVLNAWKRAEPAIAILRERGGLSALENFEYLAVRASRYVARYPQGNYPERMPRMADLHD